MVFAFPDEASTYSQAQLPEEEFFEETGHYVKGEFLQAYYSVEAPTLLYGYPRTEVFEDPISHRFVQYFDRTRFELHPEQILELRVKRSPLGEYLYIAQPELPAPKNLTACRVYGLERKWVCFAFLDFYLKHGKEAQFGFPISNLEIHDGLIVQYFQLARFEWHPENPPQQRVVISNLGVHYFNLLGLNPNLLKAPKTENIIAPPLSLNARAFPARSITGNRGIQTIYILVQNQYNTAVEGAKVDLLIQLPAGTELKNSKTLVTNEQGMTLYSFSFKSSQQGSVLVRVTIRSDGIMKTIETSFRIW